MTRIDLIADLRGVPSALARDTLGAWAAELRCDDIVERGLVAVDPDTAASMRDLSPRLQVVDAVLPGFWDVALSESGIGGRPVLALLGPVCPGLDATGVLLDLLASDPMFGAAGARTGCHDGCCVVTLTHRGAPAAEWMPQRALADLPDHVLPGDALEPAMVLAPVLLTDFGETATPFTSLVGTLWHRLLAARRAGFRVALSNRAVMRFSRAGCDAGVPTLPSVPGVETVQLRGFDNDSARAWREFRGASLASFERLTSRHHAARRGGRRSLLLDMRNVGSSHNGTAFAAIGAAQGLHSLALDWDVSILANEPGAAFHAFETRFPGWRIHTTLPNAGFNVALRLTQPWHIQEMIDLHRVARLNAYVMLDTICWDVVYAAPPYLDATWSFLAATADRLLFISDFSRQRFRARFPSPSQSSDVVCHLSFNPADYIQPDVTAQGQGEGWALIVGNHLEHKDVAATAALVASAFPMLRVETLGPTWWQSSTVRSHTSGHLAEAAVQGLYAGARLVVFPSFYEGFGLPIITALGYGRTLLARESPLLHEVAAHCMPRGRLVSFRARDELVDKIARLLHGEAVPEHQLGSAVGAAPRTWRDVGGQLAEVAEGMLARASSDAWHVRERLASQAIAYRGYDHIEPLP